MSKLFVNAVEPEGATTDLTLGDSGGGDKVVIPGTLKISGGSPGANKVLKSDADGDASWGTDVGGSLVKLASTEITTGVAAVIFNSSVVTAYDNYLIIVNGVKTAASAANGTISFSTDNGSTFIAKQKFSAHVIDMNAGSDGGIHTGTFTSDSVDAPVYFDNHSAQPLNGRFYFFNCNPENDSTFSVQCNYTASYTNQGGTEYNLFGACMYDVTAGQQINYFKLLNATQNITEGRVTLYGMDQ